MTALREGQAVFEPQPSRQQSRSLASRPSAADSVFRRVSYAAGAATVGILLAVGIFLGMRGAQALGVLQVGEYRLRGAAPFLFFFSEAKNGHITSWDLLVYIVQAINEL